MKSEHGPFKILSAAAGIQIEFFRKNLPGMIQKFLRINPDPFHDPADLTIPLSFREI